MPYFNVEVLLKQKELVLQSAKARLQWIDSIQIYPTTMNMLKVHPLQSGFIRLHDQIYSFISRYLLLMENERTPYLIHFSPYPISKTFNAIFVSLKIYLYVSPDKRFY